MSCFYTTYTFWETPYLLKNTAYIVSIKLFVYCQLFVYNIFVYIFQEHRINEELRQLSDRTEELKSAATQARDANDINALHAIGQQLELIQNRQARLLQEQHHERQIRAR